MIVLSLIKHQWLSDIRSSTWGRKLALKIFFVIFILYMIANLIVVGFVLNLILEKLYPDQTPLHSLHSWLLYALGVILVSRFFFEKVPLLAIRPYLPLNISKSKLTHFFLIKALLGLFNWLPLLMLIPFAVKVLPAYQVPGWLLLMAGLLLLLNLAILLLKKQFGERILVFIGITLFLAAVGIAGIAGWLPVKAWSATVFDAAAAYQWVSLPLMALIFSGAYLYTHRTFKSACYLDAMPEQQAAGGVVDKKISMLEGLGKSGPLIVQELRLILRNKRPRTVVFISFIFLFYGLMFFTRGNTDAKPFMMLFGCYFMTLIFLSNYGQFTFSWESNHWDGLLAWKLSFERMIKAKWYMYAGFVIISTVLAMPYSYFSRTIPIMLVALAVFQIGFNIPLMLLISTQNKKRITLTKSATFNWEGTGGSQFLMILPLMILPFVVFGPFQILMSIEAGIIALAVTGLLSMAFYKQWIQEISKNMRQRKYITANGFRQE